MKRVLVSFAVLALLALPVVAGADDTTIPPQMNWTPYPPAREIVDPAQLMELLVKKGVITPTEQAKLIQGHSAAPAGESRDAISAPAGSYVTKP
ncbi:MAG: hypothetical protein ACREOH_12755 [Candidatus Entotheonellia bacterium]|jgi:hypothetical protein